MLFVPQISWRPGTADNRNYAKRMGLNAYWIDVNAYKFEDLKPNGSYEWPVTEFVRSDVAIPDLSPTYVPYSAIATNFVLNLLIPGYATGVASLGWAAARTIPNQCVLGDAGRSCRRLRCEQQCRSFELRFCRHHSNPEYPEKQWRSFGKVIIFFFPLEKRRQLFGCLRLYS